VVHLLPWRAVESHSIDSAVARASASDERVCPIFFIVTDGEENASHEYKLDDVRHTIERLRSHGAAVIFLGANDSQW
jgi:hypothetical protein